MENRYMREEYLFNYYLILVTNGMIKLTPGQEGQQESRQEG